MKLEVGVAPAGAPNSLAGRIDSLRERIAATALRAGRDPETIVLVGITKQQSRATVLEALAAGLDDIGENYLQEARAKYTALPSVRKHFVGHVQTNKARAIVELFDVVQSSTGSMRAARSAERSGRSASACARSCRSTFPPASGSGSRRPRRPSLRNGCAKTKIWRWTA